MLRRRSALALLGALITVLLAALLGSIGAAADPGSDDLVVGPNATLTLESGEQIGFGLKARLSDRSLLMGLNGPAISACSIHGPGAQVDFNTESGNFPLQEMQCGRAFGMDIALTECGVQLEYHGFVHSDRSTRIYFGPMTADVDFQKTGANTGEMHLAIFTPKARILFDGQVQSPTPIVMTSCP